jgi:DNA-directed RNA polymerase I subunit RPA2
MPFDKFTMWFESFELKKPVRPVCSEDSQNIFADNDRMYPSECRQRGINYSSQLIATVCRKIDEEVEEKITIPLGEIPVMVRSNFCNLAGLSEDALVKKREDMHEFGGYFVINGNEKIVRMLIVAKRNYPVCFSRPNF